MAITPLRPEIIAIAANLVAEGGLQLTHPLLEKDNDMRRAVNLVLNATGRESEILPLLEVRSNIPQTEEKYQNSFFQD